MTTLEQAARQALEALDESWHLIPKPDYARLAIAALREALEPPKQEPVAWWNPRKDTVSCDPVHRHHPDCTPLYTIPPMRAWVGLTDVEIGDALIDLPVLGNGYFLRIARAIETALKDKNI
jgi:hypothetical protein